MNVFTYSTECINDYVDIWIEVPTEDANLIDSPLFGRYCGVDHLAGWLVDR